MSSQFKLPCFRGKTTTVTENNLPLFKCNQLKQKEIIGRGSFAEVFLTSYVGSQSSSSTPVVVKKLFSALDEIEKKRFFKEASILHKLNHKNIVKLLGVCEQPCALMLEYAFFSFSPFGQEDLQVSSLQEFLLCCNRNNSCGGFEKVMIKAACDIIDGLSYLHSKNIAHRDLKPGNILVSNQHYLDGEIVADHFHHNPVICKVTDFGESRSILEQTQTALLSRTSNVDRGTVVYMSPDIIVEKGSTTNWFGLLLIWLKVEYSRGKNLYYTFQFALDEL